MRKYTHTHTHTHPHTYIRTHTYVYQLSIKYHKTFMRIYYLFPEGSYLSTKYIAYKVSRYNFAFLSGLITFILITNI